MALERSLPFSFLDLSIDKSSVSAFASSAAASLAILFVAVGPLVVHPDLDVHFHETPHLNVNFASIKTSLITFMSCACVSMFMSMSMSMSMSMLMFVFVFVFVFVFMFVFVLPKLGFGSCRLRAQKNCDRLER